MATERAPGSASASVASQEQQSGSMAAMGLPPGAKGDGPGRAEQLAGGAFPGYGSVQPFQGAAQGSYAAGQAAYAPPPHAQGYSPYGYPPHVYSQGYGQAPPQSFYGGFGGYPSQHSGPQDRPQGKPSQRRKSSQRRQRSPRRTQQGMPPKSVEDVHMENLIRQRVAAAAVMPNATDAAVTTTVKPMRTAFHFFVDEMQESLEQAAVEEVRRSNGGEVDLYLLNTNLNCRLMKEWEDAAQEVRDAYLVKEEADRKRFMADDEIASRHCATLTARARSPRFGADKKGARSDDDGDDERSLASGMSYVTAKKEDDGNKRASPTENGESPTKKSRTNEDAE